ncbi:MAG TPA: LamG-like jellyroll fold domain-containing protein [Gillisia sp.]|nr:LamG-like jellyroll fold domain-containing protein [Gillisia sp.]
MFNLLGYESYRNIILIPLLLFGITIFISCGKENDKIKWKIDSIDEISGNSVIVSGAPRVISLDGAQMVEFNGKSDGLLVRSNPIANWDNFEIEVDINPYPGYPENVEQRFLHIQDPENENRRILIELRLSENNEWYGDWFIKTESESLTLLDSTQTHPLNEWATIGLKYKDGEVTGFINGEIQVKGIIKYMSPGNTAHISIGTRMDQRSWFKGAIKEVRFISLDK